MRARTMERAHHRIDAALEASGVGSATAEWCDPVALRRAFGRFATGVTVVTSRAAGRSAGLTVNSFCSVSLEPPLVLWCLAKTAPSCRVFLNATHYAVHVLAEDQAHLSARFCQGATDKFAGIDTSDGCGDVPLLDGCVATFECLCEQRIDGGDHYIMLGRVERYRHSARPPLVFHAGGYARIAT